MVKNKPKTIEEILDSVENDDKRKLVQKFRAFVKDTVPTAEEIVRRGRITYRLDGKDFSAIRITKEHVDLLFSQGSRLSSPLLKGQGTTEDPKHVEVINTDSFNKSEFARLLKEAAAITRQIS